MKSLLYPSDWSDIARDIKDANDWVCQVCQKQCRRPGELWLGWQYTLTVAHLTQDYDGEMSCVAPLCVPCHLKYDAPFVWVSRRRAQHLRRILAGQLELLPTTDRR